MAIFQDNRELQRQQRTRKFDEAKGLRKVGLAMLGYNAEGGKNLYGKMVGDMSLLNRYAAHQLAKGSDVKEVLEETDDEWANKNLNKLAFGLSLAGTVGGMPALGATGDTIGAAGDTIGMQDPSSGDIGSINDFGAKGSGKGLPDNIRTTINPKSNVPGSNMIDAINSQSDQIAKEKIEAQLRDSASNISLSDINKIDSIMSNDDDGSVKKMINPDEIGEEEEVDEENKSMKKLLEATNQIGGLAKSAMGWYVGAQSEKKEAESTIQSLKERKIDEPRFNLL